jgi:MFS family permease
MRTGQLSRKARSLTWRVTGLFLPWAEVGPEWRRGLRLFLIDGTYIALSSAFLATFMPLFALGMGASGAQVGLLTSLGSAAAVVGCALGGPVVRALHSRKRAALYFSRIGDSLSLLLVIAIPFFLSGPAAITALLTVQTVRGLFSNLGVPAWAAFVPTIVPIQIRGRYISLRSMIQVLVTVVAVPVAGFIIARLGGYPTGFQVSFTIAVTLGLVASWFFSRIPEPAAEETADQPTRAEEGSAPWWQGTFGRFLLGAALWTLASAIAGPFYVVFMSEDLGLNAGAIGLLISFATAMQLIGYALLGRVVDRDGARTLLGLSALALALVPLGWLLVHAWWSILPIYVVSGFATAGYGLTSFNLMLEVTPEQGRASYTAAYYTSLAVAGAIAPLVGARLFEQWGFSAVVTVGGIGSLAAALLFILILKRPTRS